MKKEISLSAPLNRITVLDALRGFALFGVIIMQMLQRFGAGFGRTQEEVLRFPALDEAAQWIGNNITLGLWFNFWWLGFSGIVHLWNRYLYHTRHN